MLAGSVCSSILKEQGTRNNERPDIPPSGDEIDYLTFGGI